MAKFRYYIVDLDQGLVVGSNDEDLKDRLQEEASDTFVVINTEEETYTSPSVDDERIGEYTPDEEDDDSESDED